VKRIVGMAMLLVLWLPACAAADRTDDVFARMQLGKLSALHQEVAQFRQTLSPVDMPCGYRDFRAVIHSHSYLSHDSRNTLEQMVTAAHTTSTDVIMLTDHQSKEHDVLVEGFTGVHDGVLFFPGAENRQLLIYSPTSFDIGAPPTLQDLINLVNEKGGTTFLSHVEGVRDFNLTGLTGMEIYNTHAQAMEAPGLFKVFSPSNAEEQARLMMVVQAAQRYPNEMLAALSYRPDIYLRPFDELTQRYRLTGVAANDSHSNTGIVIKAAPEGKVVIEDILGEEMGAMEASKLPFPGLVKPDTKPGDVLFKLQLDPNDVSFGHVGTFVLAEQLTPQAFLDALRAGHCYVGFEWIASPKGFRFVAMRDDKPVAIMGDELKLAPGLKLVAALPGEAVVRLYRNGELKEEASGRKVEWGVSQAGVYRVEAYVKLGGELRPWIFSNPIYVR